MAFFSRLPILAAVGAATFGVAAAQDRTTGDDKDAAQRQSEISATQQQNLSRAQVAVTYQDRENIAENGVVFRPADSKMLYQLGLRELGARIEKAPEEALKKTTIFVASADVASLPGPEAVAFVKGPVTCGRVGCKLVIVGLIDGKKTTLLETLGETIDAPSIDKIIVNRGTEFEVVWEFDGEAFVEQ